MCIISMHYFTGTITTTSSRNTINHAILFVYILRYFLVISAWSWYFFRDDIAFVNKDHVNYFGVHCVLSLKTNNLWSCSNLKLNQTVFRSAGVCQKEGLLFNDLEILLKIQSIYFLFKLTSNETYPKLESLACH